MAIVVSYFLLAVNHSIVAFVVIDQTMKLIAKIRQCDIKIRDANRIHHFTPNGTCSCQDHF